MARRREMLRLLTLSGASTFAPRLALAAAATERRFVFVIQRGAADGLATVIPLGDPDHARLRDTLAVEPESTLPLDPHFALHPALNDTGRRYAEGEALFVHAVASPYRNRSHFDGQNVLESGGAAPFQLHDGWLNRLLGLLPRQPGPAIALAPSIPLALRGDRPVTSYALTSLPQASEDLMTRVNRLYASDPQLHALWTAALQAREMAGDQAADGRRARQDAAAIGGMAASFLARPDGPRVAMIETGGWDTHTAQANRLAAQLRSLDALLEALRTGLGAAWQATTILVATEFGRTAAANGTGGTDHGTGSVAMLLGGSVRGGRVLGDWPGLGAGALLEGRDLRPTTALDALITAAVSETFGLDPAHAGRRLFPAMAPDRRLPGPLLRT